MKKIFIFFSVMAIQACSTLDTNFILINRTDSAIQAIWIAPVGDEIGGREVLNLEPGETARYELEESYFYESDPLVVHYNCENGTKDHSFAYHHHSISIGREPATENLIEFKSDTVVVQFYVPKTH